MEFHVICFTLLLISNVIMISYFSRQMYRYAADIRKLKRELNLNDDGSYIYKLSPMDFKVRVIEEMERAYRYKFYIIMLKLRVENLDDLAQTYGERNRAQVAHELIELLNATKRSYDLIMSEGDVYTLMLNQVAPGSVNSVAKRFLNVVDTRKFSVKKFDNMLTCNTAKLKVSVAGLEFRATENESVDDVLHELEQLLSSVPLGEILTQQHIK